MIDSPSIAVLAAELARQPGFEQVSPDDLTELAVGERSHAHFRIAPRGLILRVPRDKHVPLPSGEMPEREAAAFSRASASGHTPRLYGTLPPSGWLPHGALIVAEAAGRPPVLPDELPALAEALAAVHGMPLPSFEERRPLLHHADPARGAMREVERRASYLDAAGLDRTAAQEIRAELAWARAHVDSLTPGGQPVCLTLVDTHPGNFLVDEDGTATIVDLERARYSSPAVDLAHATLRTSTTWDPAAYAELDREEIAGFYRHYLKTIDPALANALRPCLMPMRRIAFLRAVTWCVQQVAIHKGGVKRAPDRVAPRADCDEIDPGIDTGAVDRVAHCLSPENLRRMRGEWLDTPNLAELI